MEGGAFYESCSASMTLAGTANISLFWSYGLWEFGYWPKQAAANLPWVFLRANTEELSPIHLQIATRDLSTSLKQY